MQPDVQVSRCAPTILGSSAKRICRYPLCAFTHYAILSFLDLTLGDFLLIISFAIKETRSAVSFNHDNKSTVHRARDQFGTSTVQHSGKTAVTSLDS